MHQSVRERLTGAGAVPPKPIRATSALDRSGTAIVLVVVVEMKMRRAVSTDEKPKKESKVNTGLENHRNSSPPKNLREDTIERSKTQQQIETFALVDIVDSSSTDIPTTNDGTTVDTMPKEPKKKVSMGRSTRHAPLGQVMHDDETRGRYAVSRKSHMDRRRDGGDRDGDDGGESELLDERTSRRIMELSRDQQREVAEEEAEAQRREHLRSSRSDKQTRPATKGGKDRQRTARFVDSSDEESDEEEEIEEEEIMVDHDEGYVTMSENIGLTAEEEALLSSMMGGQSSGEGDEEMPERRNLADIIMQKIEEKEAMAAAGGMDQDGEDGEGQQMLELPPKVVQVYTDIGKLLTHYTSGRLPKAFKVIPSLHNWEEVLYLTRPDRWTPQAMFAATRIFASNLNPRMAQRFYNLVLLDAVRADIHGNRKLNYHYYMALKKSVYKPAAFFKGILLPLCQEGCTLREAVIVASVLQRVSIPVHHSAVAIHKLANMTEYNGAASIFIRTLLNKKYSLPAPVVTSLVDHFVKFGDDPDAELPVLWHQALLVFVQRYKNELGRGGKDRLRGLMKVHSHPKITVEVRRELFGSAAFREERGEAADAMEM